MADHFEMTLEKLRYTAKMVHTIIMPDLGQTTAEGKILRWLKNPGEKVSKGDHLLEVETDKVIMEVESYLSGYLRQVLAGEGQMVSALAPIALVTDTLEEPIENSSHGQRFSDRGPFSRATTEKPTVTTAVSVPTCSAEPVAEAPRATSPPAMGLSVAPAAKILAKELGIDLSMVPGTGPGGLITRKDVERFANSTDQT